MLTVNREFNLICKVDVHRGHIPEALRVVHSIGVHGRGRVPQPLPGTRGAFYFYLKWLLSSSGRGTPAVATTLAQWLALVSGGLGALPCVPAPQTTHDAFWAYTLPWSLVMQQTCCAAAGGAAAAAANACECAPVSCNACERARKAGGTGGAQGRGGIVAPAPSAERGCWCLM